MTMPNSNKSYAIAKFVNEVVTDVRDKAKTMPCQVIHSDWIIFNNPQQTITSLITSKEEVLVKFPTSHSVESKESMKKIRTNVEWTRALAVLVEQGDNWADIVEQCKTFIKHNVTVVDKEQRKVVARRNQEESLNVACPSKLIEKPSKRRKLIQNFKGECATQRYLSISEAAEKRLEKKILDVDHSSEEESTLPIKRSKPDGTGRKDNHTDTFSSSTEEFWGESSETGDSDGEAFSKLSKAGLRTKCALLNEEKKRLKKKVKRLESLCPAMFQKVETFVDTMNSFDEKLQEIKTLPGIVSDLGRQVKHVACDVGKLKHSVASEISKNVHEDISTNVHFKQPTKTIEGADKCSIDEKGQTHLSEVSVPQLIPAVSVSPSYPRKIIVDSSSKKCLFTLKAEPIFLNPEEYFFFGDKTLTTSELKSCKHSGKVSHLTLDLFVKLFTKEDMALGNLTGKPANGHKGKPKIPKVKLHPQRITGIIEYICNFMGVNDGDAEKKTAVEKEIKTAIQNKLNNFGKTDEAKGIQYKLINN